MDEQKRERVALFRYAAIGELVNGPLARGETEKVLTRLSRKEWTIPGTDRTRGGRATLRDWRAAYRAMGLLGQGREADAFDDSRLAAALDPIDAEGRERTGSAWSLCGQCVEPVWAVRGACVGSACRVRGQRRALQQEGARGHGTPHGCHGKTTPDAARTLHAKQGHGAGRTTPDAQADERGALEARCDSLRKEFANLTAAITSASNATVITRLVTLLDDKQAALDAAEAALASAKPPTVAPTLDPKALRARAKDKVVHLADVLRRDIPAGREALRELLSEPAQVTPIMVNGAPRYLIRARLSASSVLESNRTLNSIGDPNGI
jgi:hypothetical protein